MTIMANIASTTNPLQITFIGVLIAIAFLISIVGEAEEQAVDLILIARTSVRVRGNMQQVNPAIDYVMKNAPCEVLVLSPGYSVAASNGGEARETERTATTV